MLFRSPTPDSAFDVPGVDNSPADSGPAPVANQAALPDDKVIIPSVTAAEIIPPLELPEPPRKQGRHPKGCKCGRCIQSGGTGGYEKGGTKRPATAKTKPAVNNDDDDDIPDFSDVTGEARPSEPKPLPSNPAATASVDYATMAGLTFDVSVGVLTTVFGPEWQPRSPEEKATVVGPLAAYMKAQGMTDLPPGVVLAIVAVAYSAPRLQATSTKQKITGAWLWLKSKIFRKK